MTWQTAPRLGEAGDKFTPSALLVTAARRCRQVSSAERLECISQQALEAEEMSDLELVESEGGLCSADEAFDRRLCGLCGVAGVETSQLATICQGSLELFLPASLRGSAGTRELAMGEKTMAL